MKTFKIINAVKAAGVMLVPCCGTSQCFADNLQVQRHIH